jgi:hypothetical protein
MLGSDFCTPKNAQKSEHNEILVNRTRALVPDSAWNRIYDQPRSSASGLLARPMDMVISMTIISSSWPTCFLSGHVRRCRAAKNLLAQHANRDESSSQYRLEFPFDKASQYPAAQPFAVTAGPSFPGQVLTGRSIHNS